MIIITTYTVDLPSVNAESSEIRLNECRNENDNPLIVNYSKILSFLPTHSDLSLNFLVFEPSSHKCLCRETLNPTRSCYHANTGPPSPSRYHPITVTVNEQLFVFKTRRKLEDRARWCNDVVSSCLIGLAPVRRIVSWFFIMRNVFFPCEMDYFTLWVLIFIVQ